MNESTFLDDLIARKQPIVVRLLEGRDILALPLGQDDTAIIVKRPNASECSVIYKRAISVITPMEGTNCTNDHQPT